MFKTIILGGELRRRSFLYRFLVFLRGRERIEGLTDSCGLHGQLIVATIQTLIATIVIGFILYIVGSFALYAGILDALLGVGVVLAAAVVLLAVLFAVEAWQWFKVLMTTVASIAMTFVILVSALCIGESLSASMKWITTFAPAIWLGPVWGTLYTGHLIAGLVALILIVAAFVGALIVGVIGWEFATSAYDEVTRMRLYKWLKGRLCFRIEIVG